MPRAISKGVPGVAFWVVLCALLNCAGWILSALHALDATGYVVTLILIAAGFFLWKKKQSNDEERGFLRPLFFEKLRRRSSRPFSLAFFILAGMAFLGGALYPPTNYDALAYRLPRILNWLAERHWYWIETDFQRLNVRAAGIEWVSAPLMAIFHSDRLLFLINFVSLLLLPGLIFSVFTRLGVRPRAAWYWMWLLPTGYCFLLQAGSIGNDLFGAVFGLAALDFALRARTSGRIQDVWLACLAAALLTGGKTSNFPLLLPITVALIPSFSLLRQRLFGTVAVAIVAAGASFLPMAILNFKHCGDWSGQKAEQAVFMRAHNPALQVAHNCVLLAYQNFTPPIFPMSEKWNQVVLKIMPASLKEKLELSFETGGAHLVADQMQAEEGAGLGLGVGLLLLTAFIGTLFSKSSIKDPVSPPSLRRFRVAVLASALISLVPYLWVSGATTAARLVTPYYCFIVPVFILRQSGEWIHRNAWWRRLGGLVFLLAGLLLIVTPPRPLWPAKTILSKLDPEKHPLVKRAQTVYSVYSQRAEGYAPVLRQLPADANVLGFISFDDPETSLWQPFGHRRIVHIHVQNPAEQMKRLGVRYILVSSEFVSQHAAEPLESWLTKNHLELIRIIPLNLRASRGPKDWAFAKLASGE